MTAAPPQSEPNEPTVQDLVFAIFDRLAEHGHVADVVLVPPKADGEPDIEGANPANVAPLPDDEWPVDEQARRVVIVVEGITGCQPGTSALIFLDEGVPQIRITSGGPGDVEVAEAIIARDIGVAPPVREPTDLQKSLQKLRDELFPPKLVAANDNAGGATTTVPAPTWPGIVSSGDLISRFTPPDYAIDGIVQAGFIYSVTASTGTGKSAILLTLAALKAQGLPLGGREIPRGRVVFFAGENPDDIVMRWIAAAHHMGFDPDAIDVHFVPGVFDITRNFREVAAAVERAGGAAMVIVDTSAAFFTGDDENGNVAMGKHARNLRRLTTLPGAPAVLVACHPTKNADQSNLLPRGGGAFIAEVDGNLTCQRTEAGTVKLHWQGKFRGPDFRPIHFDLSTVTAPGLIDSRGREIPTVLARPVSQGETIQRKTEARQDEDLALVALDVLPLPSTRVVAEHLGWADPSGEPHKRRAQTALNRLRKDKMAELVRDGWESTTSLHWPGAMPTAV